MKKAKVGDIVKIVRKPPKGDKQMERAGWNDSMDSLIGEVGRVVDTCQHWCHIDPLDGPKEEADVLFFNPFGEGIEDWSWPYSALELNKRKIIIFK